MTDVQTLQSPTEAARLFRSILAAFSKPAVAIELAACPPCPAPLAPAAAAVLLSLSDYQTPVWLSPSLDTDPVRKFIRFHTGASIAGHPGEAAFAVLDIRETAACIDAFPLGSDEYPDRSASLVLQTPGLSAGLKVHVEGPGLKDHAVLSVAAADAAFWQRVQANSALFPVGLDFIFTSGRAIAALPRSMSVKMREPA